MQQSQQQQSYGQPQGSQPQYQSQQPGQVQPYGYGQQSQAVGSYGRPTYSYAPAQSTSLAPQQLESVGKDEDPVYGPLARARSKVERALRGDEEISPDLADLVAAPCTSCPHGWRKQVLTPGRQRAVPCPPRRTGIPAVPHIAEYPVA